MDINVKKTKTGDNMYLFCFANKEEKDIWFSEVESVIDSMPKGYDYYKESFRKLESRVDNKYANEEYEYSGMMFESELVSFIQVIIASAVENNIKIQSYNKLLDYFEKARHIGEVED